MASRCKQCGEEIDWGSVDGKKWVPLEPIESHDGMDRSFVDENGILRADHRDRHNKNESVSIMRLDKKIKAEHAGEPDAVSEPLRQKVRKSLRR
jgi:hypothetical protein